MNVSQETNRIAITMKIEPKPETTVRLSPSKMVEIAAATIISVNRIIAEVIGEICFNPFNQK